MRETVRQKQKKATQSKILTVAMEQFSVHGFSVPTTDISKAAGLSHGSIFLHFKTKEELIDSVIMEFFDKLNGQIHRTAKNTSRIEDLLNGHIVMLQEHEGFYANLITQLSSLPKHTQEKLFAYQSTLSYHFEQVLSKEQRHLISVPIYMLFNMWIALVHYYLENQSMFAPPGGSVLELRKDELIQSYIKMIFDFSVS